MAPSFPEIFADYGSYHNNIINRAIHMIFGPLVLTTILAIITNYSVHIDLGLGKALEFNFAMVFVLMLSVLYLYMDFVSGLFSSTLYIGSALLTNRLYNELIDTPYYETYFRIVIALHAISWTFQIVGHLVFEKRAPQSSVLHSIYSILAAPNLAMIDLLFVLGYKPKARSAAKVIIDQNIAEFRQSQLKKAK